MLAFGVETRLSETTFVQSPTVPRADYRNRIFSMAGEMPFAGHPSLGTAVAVARARGVSGSASFTQQTGAGVQPLTVELAGTLWRASMLQEPASFGDELEPEPFLRALGLQPEDSHPDLRPQVVSTGLPHAMLPLRSRDSVQRILADPRAVDATLAESGAFGIYAAWCEPERGVARAREFARSAQVSEDPATGSAAGPLCAYLFERTGCRSLDVTQGVELGRPSLLRTAVEGDRVRVSGDVVVVIDGVVKL
jgi:trans-2,3-dihydro-3-hydroxyanthranilate isomerase